MKIKNLKLENFRSYHYLDIDFDDKLTVLIGDNGAGKTSVLDGLALLLGAYLRRLPEVKGLRQRRQDIRMLNGPKKLAPAFRCTLEVDATHEMAVLNVDDLSQASVVQWSISLLRDQATRTRERANAEMQLLPIGFKQLNGLVDQLIEAEEAEKDYELPVVAYYATDRAVFSMPMRKRGFKKIFSRFDALQGALQPTTNFKRFIEWMHAKENDELRQQRDHGSFEIKDEELEAVRRAITQFFPDFKKPRIEHGPLRFMVDWERTGGTPTPFDLSQLSDGYRTTLALVADLASRMAEANPPTVKANGEKTDPLKAHAIVLIDEVDLHLHPKWQSRVLHQLRAVFPNTQFVVATHSAMVVRHMHDGVVYRLKSTDSGDATAQRIDLKAPGALGDLFKDVFEVDLNQLSAEWIDLDPEQHRKAKQNLKALLTQTGDGE